MSGICEDIAARCKPAERRGASVMVTCPAHADKAPSLSVTPRGERALVYCFAGCEFRAIRDALAGRGVDTSLLGHGSCEAEPVLTVEALADYCGLPVSALASFGAETVRRGVRFPYRCAGGSVFRWKIRRRLHKGPGPDFRFEWETGRGQSLYGLDRLAEARAKNYLWMIEGESDSWVLWHHGEPALGIPGSNAWKDERDAAHLDGIETVYLVDEGDDGAAALVERLSQSRVASRVRRVSLARFGVKDVRDLHRLDAGRFAGRLAEARAAASPLVATPERAPVMSAGELLAMEFREPKTAVAGLIYEGANLLAAKPKIGKTWLMLAVSVAVASGGRALGQIEVERGEVLYLALEDGRRRIRDRLAMLIEGDPPAGLHIATEWPTLGEGGLEALDDWLSAHPETALVVVDSLKRIRPRESGLSTSTLYARDYDAVAPLSDLAKAHSASFVIVHHLRKAGSDDPLDLVSGTLGLNGAVDNVLVLQRTRGSADAVLFVGGRDSEELELALKWDGDRCLWHLLGDAAKYRQTEERVAIQTVVEDFAPDPVSPKQVCEAMPGGKYGSIRHLVRRMEREGCLVSAGRGLYTVHTVHNATYVHRSQPLSTVNTVNNSLSVNGVNETEDDDTDVIGGTAS